MAKKQTLLKFNIYKISDNDLVAFESTQDFLTDPDFASVWGYEAWGYTYGYSNREAVEILDFWTKK